MSKKLTEEQQEVWDRLKHGLPQSINSWYEVYAIFAEEVRKEIDKEIIADFKKIAKMEEEDENKFNK